ncbi:hypothetical protein P4K96_06180, partial [Bacillus cereus]|nr:hypothetical protein [Bacillus cereus]
SFENQGAVSQLEANREGGGTILHGVHVRGRIAIGGFFVKKSHIRMRGTVFTGGIHRYGGAFGS